MQKYIGLLILVILLSSHDLFLKTDHYFLQPNSLVKLYMYNGTFDNSENIITRDRIIAASVQGPGFSFNPTAGNWYDLHDATYLQFMTGGEGTYLAGISTAPKNIELSAEDFNGYLEHDGVLDVLAQRKREGILDQSAVEKYAKHVKCLIQVGDQTSSEYNKVLNYPIEFVLNNNPYTLTAGDEVEFTLLRNGKPLGDQLVYFGHRNGTEEIVDEHVHDTTYLRIDSDGKGKVKLTEAGHWYLRTIYMEKSAETGLDYESNWATITFELK